MVSEGCKNCYAEKLNVSRRNNGNGLEYKGNPPEGLFLVEKELERWPKMRRGRRIFVASMTDIFGDWVPQDWADRFLDAMLQSPQHTFQMLTKRHEESHSKIHAWLEKRGIGELPWHMQIGMSMENQKRLEQRIGYLLEIPAKVRFISAEPLLSELKFRPADLQGIQWVITGCESDGIRPSDRKAELGWFESIVEQCAEAGVPAFVKQIEIEGRLVKDEYRERFPETLRVQQFPKLMPAPETGSLF